MGSICPITRDQKRASSTKSSITSSRRSTRESHHRPSISEEIRHLKNERLIQRLSVPLQILYRTISELQSDCYSQKYLCEYRATRQPCILHILPQRNQPEFKCQLFQKLSVMDHPHILRMYDMLQDEANLYIVFEAYEGGLLEEFISRERGMSERRAATAAHQMLSALAYAHARGIAHKSLSPRSLVLKRDPGLGVITVKLTGFESADLRDHKLGRAGFLAPEEHTACANEKSDIWTCGVLILYMLTGSVPVCDAHSRELFELHLFSSSVWTTLSADLRGLVLSMLNTRPEARPSAGACLAHPWVQQFAFFRPLASRTVRTAVLRLCENQTCQSVKGAFMKYIILRAVSDDTITQLADVFRAIDRNADGVISADELVYCFRKLMPEDQAVEKANTVFAKADTNHSGAIEYSEFLVCSFDCGEVLKQKNLRKMLGMETGDGMSARELKRIFSQCSDLQDDSRWKKVVSALDTDEIDFPEFMSLLA